MDLLWPICITPTDMFLIEQKGNTKKLGRENIGNIPRCKICISKNILKLIFSSQDVQNFWKYFHKSNFDILVHTFWIETPCLIFHLIPSKIMHFDTEPISKALWHFALTFCGVPLFNNKMFEILEKQRSQMKSSSFLFKKWLMLAVTRLNFAKMKCTPQSWTMMTCF